jgi:hypothetical protein
MNGSTTFEIHEQELIRAFFVPQKRERYLELFTKPRRRKQILTELSHFKDVDPRWIVPTPSRYHHAADLVRILKEKGAPDTCWVISEEGDLDGKELLLSKVLQEILGRGMGTFLSCLPGRLAYFESEDGRWILERKGNN